MVNCSSFFVLLVTIYASYFILMAYGDDELRRYRNGLSWTRGRQEIGQKDRDSDTMRRELRSLSVNVNNDIEHLREDRGRRFVDNNDDKNRQGFEDESRRSIERESDLPARRIEVSRKERLDRRERIRNDRVEGQRIRSIESIESDKRREEINLQIGEESRSERRMSEKEGTDQSDRRIEDDPYDVNRLGAKRQDRNEMRSDIMESVDRNQNVQDRKRENLRSEEERRRSVDRENESRDEGGQRFDRMTTRMARLISDRVDNEQSTDPTMNQSTQLTSILGQLVGLIVSIALINTPSKGGYANKMKQLFTINKVTTTVE